MLTVLRVISQHLHPSAPSGNMAGAVQRDKFKIIYVYGLPTVVAARISRRYQCANEGPCGRDHTQTG